MKRLFKFTSSIGVGVGAVLKAGIVFLIALLLMRVGLRFLATIYGFVQAMAPIATGVLLFILLPASIWKGNRRLCGRAMMTIASFLQISVWISCVLWIYREWGFWAFCMSAISPFAAIPLAVLMWIIKGQILQAVALLALTTLTVVIRLVGFWIMTKAPNWEETPWII